MVLAVTNQYEYTTIQVGVEIVVILYSQLGHEIKINLFLARIISHSEPAALNSFMNQRLTIFSQAFDITQETSSHETLDISCEQNRKGKEFYYFNKK